MGKRSGQVSGMSCLFKLLQGSEGLDGRLSFLPIMSATAAGLGERRVEIITPSCKNIR